MNWSAELYRIYGVDPGSKVTYESFLSHVHPDDRDRIRRAIEQALADRSSFQITHRVLLPDGRERTLHGRGQVVLDGQGAPHRMVGTAQDVTEQHRLEALRESVLATISHELRTPLTSIIGFAVTLRERGEHLGRPLRRRIVLHLNEQALKLERLLSDLLDVDRMRHRRTQLVLDRHDLGALVAAVAGAQPTGGHVVEVNSEPVIAVVDGPKVERIVENLIVNAVKHTPRGTKIVVSVAPDGDGSVLIRVDDDGPGVADVDKRTIFDLFSRAEQHAGEVPGAGVGLALVAQFTTLHDGQAWVEDAAGGGASFRVRLPRRA